MGQDQSRLSNGQAESPSAQGTTAGAATAGTKDSVVTTVPLAGIEGFQVVRLLPYSPAHKAGLVPFFDIITGMDHVILKKEGKQALQFFKSYVANHRDQPVCFTVFNLYIRAYRDVYCVPSDAWGGGGLLGCSVEWSHAASCPERCVHVVDVLEGSPAAYSGEFFANRDYIIGMQTAQEPLISLIKNQKDFYSRLEGWHEEQMWALERKQRFPNEAVDVPHILLFLVYNSESNTVKEVAVEMGTDPEAALGMSVATGLLHIIPSISTACDAATASSLPVMNKFVRLEANGTVTGTQEPPAPAKLSPMPPTPPCSHPLQQQEEQQQRYDRTTQNPPSSQNHGYQPHSAENHVPQENSNGGGEGYTQDAPTPPIQEAVSAPHQPSRSDASAAYVGAPPAYYSSFPQMPIPIPTPLPRQDHSQQQQQQQPHHASAAYPMPLPINGNFIPPHRTDLPTVAVEPSSQADAAATTTAAVPSLPPPPPPPATHPVHSVRQSPFRSALASLEAYERPPPFPPVSAPLSSMTSAELGYSLPMQRPPVEPWTQPPSVVSQQPREAVAATEAAPPVVPPHMDPPVPSSLTTLSAHNSPSTTAPLVPPPSLLPQLQQPPPLPAVPQHSPFSTTNMPPPLNFPVFPGAAMKRPQK